MAHLMILMHLPGVNAKSEPYVLDAGGGKGFKSWLKYLEQVPSDDYIFAIIGRNFAKLP